MNKNRGFTLVEVIVTVLVSSVFVLLVGQLLVMSVQSGIKASQRQQAENDMIYFRHVFEYLFRNSTIDPKAIPAVGTIQFASKTPTGGITQNQFRVVGGNLVREYWNSTYDASGVLQPPNPYAGGGATTEIILKNVDSLLFAWGDVLSGGVHCSVWVTVNTTTILPSGGTYITQSQFTVTNWSERV